MMYGWAERLYDYSVERNKLQRAAERVSHYGITGAGSPIGVLQEAIDMLERLIKQARRPRVVASQRVVQVLDRRDGRQADNARARYEKRRGNELPVAIRRGPLIRGLGSALARAHNLLSPDRLDNSGFSEQSLGPIHCASGRSLMFLTRERSSGTAKGLSTTSMKPASLAVSMRWGELCAVIRIDGGQHLTACRHLSRASPSR